MTTIHCDRCSADVPRYDITHYGNAEQGYRELCSRCFSAEVAKVSGINDFDTVRFEPIGLADCAGKLHQFHFVTRLLGNMVTLDAFELQDGNPTGYQFQLIGDPEEDPFDLLGRMIGRIRKTLSIIHIANNADGHGLQIAEQTVRGRIERGDTENIHPPIVVVDGQEISWAELGRMVSAFEGWQFKLEILDRSDDLIESDASLQRR